MMDDDEVFQLAILCLADSIANILAERAKGNTKRIYWLERMSKAIHAVDSTYAGTLPKDFVAKADAFNQKVESDLGELLKSYKP